MDAKKPGYGVDVSIYTWDELQNYVLEFQK